MPKVSVLIPAYNVAPYIKECLDSVLSQALQDFEIICIDDASSDNTLEILRQYEDNDNRIHVFTHEKNMGQSCGRNDALKKARGEYVYMLDADDRIMPQALGELYEICSKDRLDIAAFETINFTEENKFAYAAEIKTLSYTDTDVLDGQSALAYCMENECFPLSVPTFIMRREYLINNDIWFTEGILHEDVGYILELMTRAGRVRFLHQPYFLRRIRSNSTMTAAFTDKNIEGYIKSFFKSFELEERLKANLEKNPRFKKAFLKWQRDIFGRINQLYENNSDSISAMRGGNNGEEIRRVFEIIKLSHFRTPSLPFSECYLCGTGQYTVRAIQAVGAQDIIIRGILVPEKKRSSFCGFPLVTFSDISPDIPIVLSISHYTKEAYINPLKKMGITALIEMEF